MLADGKFWEDLQHAVNTGPLLGENLDWKHEQTEMGFSLFRLLFENASTARMYYFCNLKTFFRAFPNGPVVKTPCFQCRGAWVQSLVRELDPTCCK